MMERVVRAQFNLTAREYKLLLDPERFTEAYGRRGVHEFWERSLKPVIAERLDRRRSGKPRFKGEFGRPTERTVRFWDTDDMALTRNEWSLRQRTRLLDSGEEDPEQELTLKLRTSDLFIAAATAVASEDRDVSGEFEEDIAPLGVTQFDASGSQRVVLSDPASVRCRFARAFKRKIHDLKPLGRMAEIYRLFHGFDDSLTEAALGSVGRVARLLHGDIMLERAYNGAAVALGDGVDGRFTLTEWHLQRTPRVQRVAEISFKLAIPGGGLPRSVAQRALTLFTNLQDELGTIINLKDDSKTALALPSRTLVYHRERYSHARPEAGACLRQ
jgi:hypothetical protein